MLARIEQTRTYLVIANHTSHLIGLEVELTREGCSLGPSKRIQVQTEEVLLRLGNKVEDSIDTINPLGRLKPSVGTGLPGTATGRPAKNDPSELRTKNSWVPPLDVRMA